MNNNSALSKVNNLIFGLIALVSFLTPVFFLTTTYEFFEFNKLYFFVASAAILALMWCAKMIVERKVYVAKSPIDFGLLLLMASMVLSTLTSLDKTSSLFGSYGRWFPSLFGFIALYFFYYAVSTNVDSAKKIRTILYAIAGGSGVASVFGIFNYFGLVFPFLNLINQKGFLLSGSSSTLASVALTGAVLSSILALNIRSTVKRSLMLAAFLFNFIALSVFGGIFFTGTALAVIALALVKSPKEAFAKNKVYFYPVIGAVIAFVALYFVVPQTRTALQKDYPREILPNVRESWVVSSTTLRDFPIFGSGVSTFYLNYPRYQTLSQNYTPTWNVNFDKPVNELFNIISTLGIFGLLAYGYLITTIVKLAMRSLKVNDAYKGLTVVISATLITTLLSMLLTYSSFQSVYMLFILLSLLTAEAVINTNKSWSKITSISIESKIRGEEGVIAESQMIYRQEILQYIIALPIVAVALFGMYQVYLQYMPEFYVRKAITAAANQDINGAYDYQVKAIATNAQRSQYHRLYANTNLTLAQSLALKQNLTDQEKTAAQNLLAQSLRNVKYVTETLNPLDSANWETRARIYRFLIPAAKDADQFAIQAYNTAIQLDPTNPALRVELGGIYFGKEDYLSAGNLFKQAVNLKGDYANARYNLAHALYRLRAFADAKAELEVVQYQVQKDSPDYQLVVKDIEEVNKQLSQIAGAQDNKPSVQSIEQAGQTQPAAANQQPLTNPAQQAPAPAVQPEPVAPVQTGE